jgi:glycosyltransferase involved in cell wall biosynthesis
VRLGYVCQYFTSEYRGPVTNLMSELSRTIDVCNYSSREKHMQYYSGGAHSSDTVSLNQRLTLCRYDVAFKLSGVLFPRNLMAQLERDKPDVLQSEEYYQPASHQALKYARSRGKPFIFNHRGSELRRRTLRERTFFALANPLSRRLVSESDAIVCLSKRGEEVLCGIFPKARGKVRIIPNSIDPAQYSGADGAGFRSEYKIPAESPLLLCVARLHPQKRIDLLVRAFGEVKRQEREAVLAIVGPWFDEEKRKVDGVISDLGIEDVVFCGPMPNERVKDAYAAADVVALTSEYEPFGYCLLEAMALGKPTIAFDIGAVSEIIDEGVSGYRVPFADTKALAQKAGLILADRSLAGRMGKAGLARVISTFSLKENAAKMVSLYRELGVD